MTDEQANKIVRAAWILGIAFVVGMCLHGGMYRIGGAGGEVSRAYWINTWTGSTGQGNWRR